MTSEDAKLAEQAHKLVTDRERKHLLGRAKSLRAQAASKIKQADTFERMAKALEPPGSS